MQRGEAVQLVSGWPRFLCKILYPIGYVVVLYPYY
ncbi:hypothetical protein PaecuDRAFT_3550 [Paenibacillus curdlanolyticus YK9]|uniref:Uncharacterized protein n=1 Tax=Paenibacillus curdlanolyticus YK9 TaxID=717606 RepID=E0ID48_9BACL|nr:hypothetical protein PaecuDRAFT_3550 [Paenibacillus curdlanolyticus YK9]